MSKNIKKKLSMLVIVLLIIVLLLNIITYTQFLKSNELIASTKLKFFFISGNKPGFAVEDQFIHFGKLSLNSTSTKTLILQPIDRDVFVIIKPDSFENNIFISPNNFILEKNTSRLITIKLINNNIPYGNYSGNISIYYFKIK